MEFVVALILAAVFGACVGSFINTAVIRVRNVTAFWGRSRCERCQTMIRPRHLVPIFSWIWLRGRCAFCHKKIHFQYPLIEACAATIAIGVFIRFVGMTDGSKILLGAFEFLFACNLLFLAAMDARFQLVPVEWVWGSSLVFFLAAAALGMATVFSLVLGGVIGLGFLGLQTLLSRGRWMGAGDPWVGALIGLSFGWPLLLVALYFTYLFGGVYACFLLLTGRGKPGTRLSFVPFLALGAFGALWFGERAVQWVQGFFV